MIEHKQVPSETIITYHTVTLGSITREGNTLASITEQDADGTLHTRPLHVPAGLPGECVTIAVEAPPQPRPGKRSRRWKPRPPRVEISDIHEASPLRVQAPCPVFGTCGGCQHALIEYARNVLGLPTADHAENNPSADLPLIAPLLCPLVETSDTIMLVPGTRIADLYGKAEIVEQYHCSFGPSIHYQSLFEDGRMRIAGFDKEGQARAFELTTHPFFLLTLFQPERSAFSHVVHPLIRAYVQTIFQTAAL